MNPFIIIRGGGDLASGVALRLYRVGFQIGILELDKPLAVRRTVSFSEAVYIGAQTVEDVTGRLISADQIQVTLEAREIPILIDPNANILNNQFLTSPSSTFVIDARLTKKEPEPLPMNVAFHIGLGPGFVAGENCDAVIETRRSHTLGRVYWQGGSQPDSGAPEGDPRRVLRAPAAGAVEPVKEIGDRCKAGETIALVNKTPVVCPFDGVLGGVLHPRGGVTEGLNIGGNAARAPGNLHRLVSDKALSIGGGVLEAVMIKLREREMQE